MFGQQLGRLEIDSPVEPPFGTATDAGHLRPLADSTGFSEGRGWFATGAAPIDPGTFARRRDAWGFQHVEAWVAPPPVERGASFRTAHDLGSRRPTAIMETMLRQLLSGHRVLAARKLADAVSLDQTADESLRRLLIVLAEPVVRRRRPARAQSSNNLEWLRRNAGSHAGRWVALADGELLAAGKSLAALRRKLTELAPPVKPFVHRL